MAMSAVVIPETKVVALDEQDKKEEHGVTISTRDKMVMAAFGYLRAYLSCWFYTGVSGQAEASMMPLYFGLVGVARVPCVFVVGLSGRWEVALCAVATGGYLLAVLFPLFMDGAVLEMFAICAIGALADTQPFIARRVAHLSSGDTSVLSELSRIMTLGYQIGFLNAGIGASLMYQNAGWGVTKLVGLIHAVALTGIVLYDYLTWNMIGERQEENKEQQSIPPPITWIDLFNNSIVSVSYAFSSGMWSFIPAYLTQKAGYSPQVGAMMLSGSCLAYTLIALLIPDKDEGCFGGLWLFKRPHIQTVLLFAQAFMALVGVAVPGDTKVVLLAWALVLLVLNCWKVSLSFPLCCLRRS